MTDEGLAAVARLRAMRNLDISHCWRFTDGGLALLHTMPWLSHLDIAYCWQVWLMIHVHAVMWVDSGTV